MTRKTTADWLVLAIGTGLFLGMVPPRTATFATVLGIPLAIGLHWLVGWTYYLPIILSLWVIGIPICARSAQLLGLPDPREVTYDEYVTLPIVYFLVPSFSWQILVVGFVLHRFFDILKPLGIHQLQRLGGGVGIMIDDLVASFYGLAVMQLILWMGYLS